MFRTASLALVLAASASPAAFAQDSQPAASQNVVDEVVVRAQRGNETHVVQGGEVGVLGAQDGLDTPFDIRSYTAPLILNQQAETLGEVLQNDPTVRTSLGYGNFSEGFVIRGFELYGDDVSIDGLYGITPRQLVSPELYDQVQVLDGANAFLNGVTPGGSGVGGGVNLVLKEAGDTPLTRLTAQYRGDSSFGGALDVSRRFGPGDAFGARLNAAGHDGGDAIDGERRDDVTAGAAFDWRSDRARVALDVAFQRYHVQDGRTSVLLGPDLTAIPRPPSNRANYSQAWTFSTLQDVFGVLDAQYRLAGQAVAYLKAGARYGTELGDYSSVTVDDAVTGEGTGGRLFVPGVNHNEASVVGLRAPFATGAIGQEVNLGLSAEWNVAAYGYALGQFPAAVQGDSPYDYATNLYHPAAVARPEDVFPANLDLKRPINRTILRSAFLSDTLSALDGGLKLVAGLRLQDLHITGFDYLSGASTGGYTKSALTPVVGLVVRPAAHVSLYFNRIEALSQGPVAPADVVNAGQIFPPYQSTQYEVGAKYEGRRASATLALFTITEPQAYSVPAPGLSILEFREDGRQRNQGVELTFSGEPVSGLRLIGGATVIDAELTRTAGGLYDGAAAIGVPDYTVNASVEYDLPFLPGVTLTGGVIRTGPEAANEGATLEVKGWTRVDLGARYVTVIDRRAVTFRAVVDNVADSRYWASATGGYLTQGLPIVAKLSASIDF